MGILYLIILFIIITIIFGWGNLDVIIPGILSSILFGLLIGGLIFVGLAPRTDLSEDSEIIESYSYDLISLDKIYDDANDNYIIIYNGNYYGYYLNKHGLISQIETTNLTYEETPKLYYYKWYNSNNKLVRHLFANNTSEKYIIAVPYDNSAATTRPSGFSLTFTKN